jgi:hypothetical protein
LRGKALLDNGAPVNAGAFFSILAFMYEFDPNATAAAAPAAAPVAAPAPAPLPGAV